MVIILQQTSENGNKFISTVVDTPQDSSFNSNFSLNSQLSISERSAAYKQRIDSLFGRTSRVSSFNPNGEPFRIRIDGKSLTPTKGLMGSNHTPSTITAPSTVTLREENEGRILSTSEDDDYSQINDKGSVIADSLNHKPKPVLKKGTGNSGNNISSVRITCEDSESSGSQLQSLVLTSSSGEEAVGRSETTSDQIMWRNSNYGETSSPANVGENPPTKPFSTVRCSPGGMLKFSVEYLGSVPVRGNTAALQDLQAPLRSLYMHYLSSKNMMTGQLAITSDGLRFEAPKVRLVNPFTTIAVWAAVKFVGRGDPLPTECAFMPLISDPEGQDKSRLFGEMDSELSSVYQNCIADPTKNFKNPPIFACVMREASFSLDCHAFACKCAEDAIVIAANLYQSLVDKMRSGKEGESGYGSLTRGSPTTQSSMNQNRSSSSASSTPGPSKVAAKNPVPPLKPVLTQVPSSSSTQNECRAVFSDSESIVPVRPPRRKKKAYEIPAGNLKRYNSDDSVLLNLPYRRRSFKASYQGHYIKNKKRVQIHTPDESSSGDSFSDSVDQVLDRIVNPCGMSFNDLKPAYQELILKIALTLTQDQLYKKSKQAMKKQQLQQKPGKKQKSAPSSAEASDDNSQFVNQFLKSISKITSSGKVVGNMKRSPTKVPAIAPRISSRQKQPQKILTKLQKPPIPAKAILKKTKEDDIPFMSFCSGCVCDNCSDKCYCSLPSKQVLGAVGAAGTPPTPTSSNTTGASTPQHPACSSTAETDVPRSKKSCGYDTDSCAESEKCYCSLQRVKSNGLKIYNINLDTETSDTDTNSYDLEPFNNPKMSEMHGDTGSCKSQRPVEILSYHPSRRLSYCFSPTSAAYMKNISPATHTSGSEKRRDKPIPTYSKNVSKKFRELNVMDQQLSTKKVLLITGSNASGQVVYKDSPFNFRQGLDFGDGLARRIDPSKIASKPGLLIPEPKPHCESPSSNSSTPDVKNAAFAPEKVLSMKKAAEIAAMFTDLNLNRTADFTLTNNSDTEDTHTRHQEPTSIDFETSLGYLP
ncbi:unnamed protein product [Orchesella dallaii]|uniref:PID domain-containing protein n=1 Tax=Orchesella dallaii TaxID=48710 RepID=A0ABP1R073_9HEXA